MHLLCKGKLEVVIGDVEGFSPTFTHLQLNLIPKITHLQLENLLAANAPKELKGSKGDRSTCLEILEGRNPLSKEYFP